MDTRRCVGYATDYNCNGYPIRSYLYLHSDSKMIPYAPPTRLILSIAYMDFSSVAPILDIPSAKEILNGVESQFLRSDPSGSFTDLHAVLEQVQLICEELEPSNNQVFASQLEPRYLTLSFDSQVALLDIVDWCFDAMKNHKFALEMLLQNRPDDMFTHLEIGAKKWGQLLPIYDCDKKETREIQIAREMKLYWSAAKAHCHQRRNDIIVSVVEGIGTKFAGFIHTMEDQLVKLLTSSWYSWLAFGHFIADGAKAFKTNQHYPVISSSTDITPLHISQLNDIEDVATFCLVAHRTLDILQQRNERKRVRVVEQQRHLNEKLRVASEAQHRASSKLQEKMGEKRNQEHELARQASEMDSLRAQIRHEDAEVARLRHEMQRQEERQSDGILSINPVFGIVNAIIKQDAVLAIPGYASIDTLISAIRGDLASSQERLTRTQHTVGQLQNQAEHSSGLLSETQSEIDRLAVDMFRFQSEIEKYDTSIRSTGQELCTVNGQVLRLQSKYQFLRDDIDLLQELGGVTEIKAKCVEDLSCLSLAL